VTSRIRSATMRRGMSASIPVQIGQVIDNKFRVDRVLAQGGMGVLCAATHLHLDQKIAVKFRLAGSKVDATRFIREAQLAVRLHNRHVCRVMDLGFLDEATPYIVMEYLDGNDLAKEVDDRGPLPIEEAVEYLLQACDAMAEAHSLGIVHRDLKPENLFLARQHDGRSIVKVLDFGISKQHGVNLTTESDLMGTPAYMAHEQWASAKHVTSSADIYALGATLHFLLTGAPPFEATTIPEMFAKISTETPPPLRRLRGEVPEEIERLVTRCLRRAAERPADVLEISDALLPFAPGRKRAALSVVGRSLRSPTPAPETESMSASRLAVTAAPGSPLSTNDLAVSVRSSSDDVPPQRRVKTAVFAIGGLALIATVVIVVAATRGGNQATEGPREPITQPAVPDTTIASTPDASLTEDVALARATEPDASIAAAPAPDANKRPTIRFDAGRPVAAAIPIVPADAAVASPPPVDATPARPATPDARCKTDDYRCKFGT